MGTVREGRWSARAGHGGVQDAIGRVGSVRAGDEPWSGSAARTWRAAALRMGGGFRMSRDQAERREVSSCLRVASDASNGVRDASTALRTYRTRVAGLLPIMDWDPPCGLLAAVQHPRCPLLHRGPHRSPGALWPPSDLQHRPGGSQFTSLQFTDTLKDAGVAISMDGSGRCMDNIFIERLWRSFKYEAVYLHELSDGFQAQRVIARWMEFYNTQRPHSALDGSTPAETYDEGMLMEIQAEPHRSPAPLLAQPEHENVLNGTPAA